MKIAKTLALGLACALAAAGSAQAQSQPKQFVNVLTVHCKPEGAVDYEAFVKKVMTAADKIGSSQRVVTFQLTMGSPGYTYMIATYFDKWTETDESFSAPDILTKALGELEAGKALRAGRQNIESTESAVYRLVPDLSTKPRAYDPPPAYLQAIRTYVKPDMVREWEHVIGRYKAAAEQIPETPTSMRRVSVEGPANVYITTSPYTKGADRDAWPTFMDILKKAYGDEEARNLDQRRAACVDHSEAFIMKYRADLSRMGK
jgi:hypothetical protein